MRCARSRTKSGTTITSELTPNPAVEDLPRGVTVHACTTYPRDTPTSTMVCIHRRQDYVPELAQDAGRGSSAWDKAFHFLRCQD